MLAGRSISLRGSSARPGPVRRRAAFPHSQTHRRCHQASRAAVVDTSISRRRVARELTALIARRGKPGVIVRDNGTEFTSNAILDRAEKMQVTWHGIAPGRPMQTRNGEAFNERGSGRPCLADRAHAS